MGDGIEDVIGKCAICKLPIRENDEIDEFEDLAGYPIIAHVFHFPNYQEYKTNLQLTLNIINELEFEFIYLKFYLKFYFKPNKIQLLKEAIKHKYSHNRKRKLIKRFAHGGSFSFFALFKKLYKGMKLYNKTLKLKDQMAKNVDKHLY